MWANVNIEEDSKNNSPLFALVLMVSGFLFFSKKENADTFLSSITGSDVLQTVILNAGCWQWWSGWLEKNEAQSDAKFGVITAKMAKSIKLSFTPFFCQIISPQPGKGNMLWYIQAMER